MACAFPGAALFPCLQVMALIPVRCSLVFDDVPGIPAAVGPVLAVVHDEVGLFVLPVCRPVCISRPIVPLPDFASVVSSIPPCHLYHSSNVLSNYPRIINGATCRGRLLRQLQFSSRCPPLWPVLPACLSNAYQTLGSVSDPSRLPHVDSASVCLRSNIDKT